MFGGDRGIGARRLIAIAAAAASLALVACGGDEETSTTTTTEAEAAGATGATGSTGPSGGGGGTPTADAVAECAAEIPETKATAKDGDVSVDVPRLELDAGVPPSGGAPATGEVSIEFFDSFISLVFFDDPGAAEDAIKLVEEEESTKAEEGRLGTAGTVLYYVTFSDPAPESLDAVNACLTDAGGEPIPAASGA